MSECVKCGKGQKHDLGLHVRQKVSDCVRIVTGCQSIIKITGPFENVTNCLLSTETENVHSVYRFPFFWWSPKLKSHKNIQVIQNNIIYPRSKQAGKNKRSHDEVLYRAGFVCEMQKQKTKRRKKEKKRKISCIFMPAVGKYTDCVTRFWMKMSCYFNTTVLIHKSLFEFFFLNAGKAVTAR